MTYVSMHDIDFFFKFKVCWITLVECGQYKPMMVDVVRGEIENKFEKENLDINFRNAKHISQVSNSFIDRHYVSNPYSGAIRTPSSFVAHQQAIEVKFEESIDYENLASKNDFLDKKISDRLIVIISDEVDDAMKVDVDKMKKTWGCLKIDDIDVEFYTSNVYLLIQLSGCEFQSVLIVIDVDNYLEKHNFAVNEAVSRAQYEVGILAKKAARRSGYLEDYLKGAEADYVKQLKLFLSKQKMKSDWLQPADLDLREYKWWLDQFSKLETIAKTEKDNLFNSQPAKVRLQIAAILPDAGIREEKDISTTKLRRLNLLYWSILSKKPENVQKYLDYLSRKNILAEELTKRYPNATIVDVAVRLAGSFEDNYTVEMLSMMSGRPEFSTEVFLNEFIQEQKGTVFHYTHQQRKPEKRSVLEYVLFNSFNGELFHFMFLKDEICNLLFEKVIRFEPKDTSAQRLQKYKQFLANLVQGSFTSLISCILRRFRSTKYFENSNLVKDQLNNLVLALKLLSRYPDILEEDIQSGFDDIADFLESCLKKLDPQTDKERLLLVLQLLSPEQLDDRNSKEASQIDYDAIRSSLGNLRRKAALTANKADIRNDFIQFLGEAKRYVNTIN
ncbi:uncharacterized protein LOC142351129 [Convolutriloba macropyga]|uniref:uncharacterized protein LOC142351129 n=1 Tax=Convolutriloba macropyga TaxID=536237 RepID=UPI003F527E11